jgi:hypothetical protein
MAILKGFRFDGNEVTMQLAEGAWTDSDLYKEGGYFAAPLKNGNPVKMSSDYRVTLSGTGDTPIGYVKSILGGENKTNGRWGTIKLFGLFVNTVEMATASDAVAVGGSVQFSTSGGTYGEGTWVKDTANDTIALNSTSASGSIAAGERIHVLFGAVKF